MITQFPDETTIKFADKGFQTTDIGQSETSPIPSMAPIPEYASFNHLVAVGHHGLAPRKCRLPEGVCIQEGTGNIYVTDSDNGRGRVQIFSKSGEFLKQFGASNLSQPCGIIVHNRHVYVTDQELNALFLFELPTFRIIKYIGEKGSGHGQFFNPGQIAISPNQLLFVAECGNNRLQILDFNLAFQGLLHHPSMTHPVDIKFSTNQILVLSITDSPCVHMFTQSGEKIRSIITRGDRMQVIVGYFFCLDGHNNIIISDYYAHSIKIFSPEGDLIQIVGELGREFGKFCYPKGVAILNNVKLVSVCSHHNFPLQIISA